MITRDEFRELLPRVIEELGVLVVRDAASLSGENLNLRTEIDEALLLCRDRKVTRAQVLAVAIGLVDEFLRAGGQEVVDEVFTESTHS